MKSRSVANQCIAFNAFAFIITEKAYIEYIYEQTFHKIVKMYSLQNSDYFKLRELARFYILQEKCVNFIESQQKNELNTQMKSFMRRLYSNESTPINHLYYNPKRIQYILQDSFIQALSRSLQFLYLLVAAGVRLNLSPEI